MRGRSSTARCGARPCRDRSAAAPVACAATVGVRDDGPGRPGAAAPRGGVVRAGVFHHSHRPLVLAVRVPAGAARVAPADPDRRQPAAHGSWRGSDLSQHPCDRRGFARTVLAGGDIAPPRTYPRQDVLIVRGQFAEAAGYFRDHLTLEPEDCDARLRLADLLERYLKDDAGAEREYLEVRRRATDPRHVMMAANGLIDLYRRAGNRGRSMVELARFAARYRGSAAGDAAARELKGMKA